LPAPWRIGCAGSRLHRAGPIARLLCLLGLAWLLAAPAALAQIPGLPPATKADSSAEKPAEPVTIPIADIAARADSDEDFVQDVIKRSAEPGKAVLLARDLAALARHVEELDQKTPASRLGTMPISRLESLDRYLNFLDRELRQWQADLQAAARPVSADAAEIVQRRKLWKDTREAAGGDLPEALAQRIDELLKQFARAEAAISQPLARLLALGRDGSAEHARVTQAIVAVRAQIATVDRQLWQRDTVDLWSALRGADPASTVKFDVVLDNLGDESNFVVEFDRSFRSAQNAVLVLALLLLPLFLWLSVRARAALAADPALERHRLVLTRPFAAWLLLALTMLLVMHLVGPATRLKMLFILAWLPIMRLQPARSRELLGGWVHVTGLFIALNVAAHLVSGMPLAFRLMVLANSTAMLAALLGLLRRLRARPAPESDRLLRSLPVLVVLGIAAIGVAIAANLLGNVTLAAMLTDAMVSSAYLGLFLLAAGNVIRGWTSWLMRPKTAVPAQRSGHAAALPHAASRLFDLLLLLLWLYGTLNALRALRPLQDWMAALAATTFRFGSLSVSVGGIVLFCVSVFLSFWIAKTVRGVLAEDVLPRMTLPRGVANSASTMSYYLLLLLGLMVALAAAGFELSQLALVLGALSVGIGFGLQTVVNNFVSGLILMFERPIQPGDTVELSGTIGTVRDIGMRATTFTTFEGADVVVPNGMLLSDKLINWTLSTNTRRIDVPVGVAYGSDPEQVLALLTEVVGRVDGVARYPAPTVLFSGFGASSLDFSVRAWTGYDEFVFVRSALGLAIHAALKRAGIEIPFPQQDLHLRSIAPELVEGLQRKPP
jgi:small-conductance mechanosensitive channel